MTVDRSRLPDAGLDVDGRSEHCPACSRVTPHSVALEIREENSGSDQARKYSREPYRVVTCRQCGRTTAQRMNGA